jgi:adenylate cyclase
LPLEVERKFLIPKAPGWLASCRSEELEQGYLAIEADDCEVRVRHSREQAVLTVKRGSGLERTEVEVKLGQEQFDALWPLTDARRVSKRRHHVPTDFGRLQVDVYRGALEGLIVAEVEFDEDERPQDFEPPDWFGEEVTGNRRYANKSLASRGAPGQER